MEMMKKFLLFGVPCSLIVVYFMAISSALKKIFLDHENSELLYMKYLPMNDVASQDMVRNMMSLGLGTTCNKHVATMAYVSLSSAKRHEIHKIRAKILMTGRDDGYLGFPGGFVSSSDASILHGLQRELNEELAVLRHTHLVPNQSHYLISHHHSASRICVHLFSFQLPMKDLLLLLSTLPSASRFQEEGFGYVFPPLFIMSEQESGSDGLPTFLAQRFVGNTLQQLYKILEHDHLLSQSEWSAALKLAQKSRHFHKFSTAYSVD